MREKRPISILIIIFSLALFCSYHIYYYFVNMANNNLKNKYYELEITETINTNLLERVGYIDNDKSNSKKEEYMGLLIIPKIKLEEGFYNKESNYNNVSNSVTLLKESIMPENNGSIVYFAAHSGVGHLAYFKDIDKLTNGDIIKLKYNGREYIYTITNIYEMIKNGKIEVERNTHEDYLVLTTCSKNKNMQLIIVSKLLNKK